MAGLRRVLLALLATAVDAVLLALALGGVPALMQHARALALLVVWALGTVVLAWMRPVRSQDPVVIDRDPALVLAALFLLPLLAAPFAALGERHGLWTPPWSPAVGWLGVLVSGLGLLIRIVAMAQLGSRFAPVAAMQREHPLETHGLYAVVRHPGYLGAWLAVLGGALAFHSLLGLPLLVVMAVLLELRVRREEALLEGHFGEAYRSYRARTGRFLPRPGLGPHAVSAPDSRHGS